MRHVRRCSHRARRSGGALVFVLWLLISCGGSEPATVASAEPELPDPGPFSDAPTVLGEFPPSLPYLYDRVVAHENLVAIGVPSDPADEADPGRVVVHARGDGAWDPTVVAPPPTDAVDAFGQHLALDGTTLGVTANRRDPETGRREAVVYLYERTAEHEWLPTGVLLGSEGVSPGSLTLALRGDVLAVAHRPSFAEAGAGSTGFDVGPAVRLFERHAGGRATWSEVEPVLAPDRDDGRAGFFGADVEIAPGGNLLAVADTTQESDSGFGTYVFLFERSAPGEAWTLIRTFRDDELPSPYSAMLELDDDALVVTPMASRETTRAELAIFERDAGGPDAWGSVATATVEVATPPDESLPRDVLLATSLADDRLAVGIGPSACMDLHAEPGPGPAPCAGGRVYLLAPTEAGSAWEVRSVIDDPTGAVRSSYGEYVAIGPHGRTVVAGGVVVPEDGPAHTHLEVYGSDP